MLGEMEVYNHKTHGHRWRPELPPIEQLEVEIDPGYFSDTGEEEPSVEDDAKDMDETKIPSAKSQNEDGTEERKYESQDNDEGKDDEAKFSIFGCNLLLWESDIGEEVKAWTAENWARWKEEKPAWFKVEIVPDRFVPAGELEQLGYNRKRRGSAVESVRESVRESMREDDEGGEEDGE